MNTFKLKYALVEMIFDDYSSEHESNKEGKESESKVSKIMEDQKWIIGFNLLHNSDLTFSHYISNAHKKGLPSVSYEIVSPPPDIFN